MKLTQVKPGQKGQVLNVAPGHQAKKKLYDIGITPGVEFEMVACHPFKGPIVVNLGNSRIAVGRHLADTVSVKLE